MSLVPYVIEQTSRGAVSYTHLDVYKRQESGYPAQYYFSAPCP